MKRYGRTLRYDVKVHYLMTFHAKYDHKISSLIRGLDSELRREVSRRLGEDGQDENKDG